MNYGMFPQQVPMGHSFGPWHVARGGLPQSEHGFDVRVRTQRRGQHVYAMASLSTPWGPVELMARADMAVLQGVLGVTGAALANLGARLATEGVMKKVSEVTCSPKKQAAAESLYKRLVAKEPLAWRSAKTLRRLARMGNMGALEGYQCLRAAHAKAKAVQVGPVTGPGAAATSGCAGSGFEGYRGSYHPLSEQDMQLSGCASHSGTQLSGFYPFQQGSPYQFPDTRLPGAMIAGQMGAWKGPDGPIGAAAASAWHAPPWMHFRYPKPTHPPPAGRGVHAAGFAVLTALGRL